LKLEGGRPCVGGVEEEEEFDASRKLELE